MVTLNIQLFIHHQTIFYFRIKIFETVSTELIPKVIADLRLNANKIKFGDIQLASSNLEGIIGIRKNITDPIYM